MDDYKIMLDILEWEIHEKIRFLEKNRGKESILIFRTKKKLYQEMIEVIRSIHKGAV